MAAGFLVVILAFLAVVLGLKCLLYKLRVEEAEEELWEERALSASLAAQVMKLKSKINHRGTESTEGK